MLTPSEQAHHPSEEGVVHGRSERSTGRSFWPTMRPRGPVLLARSLSVFVTRIGRRSRVGRAHALLHRMLLGVAAVEARLMMAKAPRSRLGPSASLVLFGPSRSGRWWYGEKPRGPVSVRFSITTFLFSDLRRPTAYTIRKLRFRPLMWYQIRKYILENKKVITHSTQGTIQISFISIHRAHRTLQGYTSQVTFKIFVFRKRPKTHFWLYLWN